MSYSSINLLVFVDYLSYFIFIWLTSGIMCGSAIWCIVSLLYQFAKVWLTYHNERFHCSNEIMADIITHRMRREGKYTTQTTMDRRVYVIVCVCYTQISAHYKEIEKSQPQFRSLYPYHLPLLTPVLC